MSYDSTEQSLKELFSQAGEVESVSVLVDRATGRPRGFGFVEMATDEGSAKAVEMFNGFEHDGRKLVVNEARPQGDRPARPRSGGFRRGGYGGGHGGDSF